MAYSIIVSIRAQNEIENAIDYYLENSSNTPLSFITALKTTYISLSINPFYRVRYKNIRALKIKKFPYSLYFIINESQNTVRVLSCYHNKRSPIKRPRY